MAASKIVAQLCLNTIKNCTKISFRNNCKLVLKDFKNFVNILSNRNKKSRIKCLPIEMLTYADEMTNFNSEAVVAYSCLRNGGMSKSLNAIDVLEKHIEVGNAELAVDDLNRYKKGLIRSVPLKTVSKIIDLCIQKNFIKNLSSNAHMMNYIIENSKVVLKPILEKYSAVGDIEKLNVIRNFMPAFTLKIIDFNAYFVKALIKSNQPEDLLAFLEERFDYNMLISVAAFEELIKVSELQDRTIQLATKFLDKNFFLPLAVIWAHFFTTEMYYEANRLLDTFPKAHSCLIEKVDTKVLKAIRKDENIVMGYKFLNLIKKMDLRLRIKERAYGTVLEILVMRKEYKDAVTLVLEADEQNLELKCHYRSTLLSLKEALEKNGMHVPFKLPT